MKLSELQHEETADGLLYSSAKHLRNDFVLILEMVKYILNLERELTKEENLATAAKMRA